MDAKELRGKSAAELTDELLKLRKEQFALRNAARHGSGSEAGPVHEGTPEHRAVEDRAARAQVAAGAGSKK